MDRNQTREYLCNEILHRNKKEGTIDTCINLDECPGHCAELQKPVLMRQILCVSIYIPFSKWKYYTDGSVGAKCLEEGYDY